MVSCIVAAWGRPIVFRLLRNADALMQACVAAEALCSRFGYQEGLLITSANKSIALGLLGHFDQAQDLMRQVLITRQSMGSLGRISADLGDLAAVCIAAGRFHEAGEALDKGLAFVRDRNERWLEAELYRIRGDLLLALCTPVDLVESTYLKAIEVSRQQKAKLLELRAASSLASLWRAHHRISEACDLLENICNWFTEGFGAPDLVNAQNLLQSYCRLR